MKPQYSALEEKMNRTVTSLNNDYAAIRASRANTAILDRIFIDYYGASTPLNQLAGISVQEAKIIVIQPYDSSILKSIEKAIQVSDIGINPQNDGKVIRLTFPPLTEERRKDLCKEVHKLCEDAKVAIRSIRRDALEEFKAQKKKSEITEDDLKSAEKDVQEITDKFCKKLEELAAAKEKDILSV